MLEIFLIILFFFFFLFFFNVLLFHKNSILFCKFSVSSVIPIRNSDDCSSCTKLVRYEMNE